MKPTQVILLASIALCGTNLPAPSQSIRVIPLKGTGVRLSEEFVAITSVRELPDGRVLMSDPRGKRVVLGDFAKDTVARIGRLGGGPKEYRNAFPVLPWRADSSIIADWLSRRWTLLAGAEIIGELPPDHPVVSIRGAVRGTDSSGFVLVNQFQRTPTESALVLRVSLSGASVDTVARLPPIPEVGNPKLVRPFLRQDKAAMTLDGWVAIVHSDPYRVDWRRPDRRWILGKPIPEVLTAISAKAKEEWLAMQATNGVSFPRGAQIDWPEHFPAPNLNYDPIPATDGSLLIRRTRLAKDVSILYDIIDRTGRRKGQLALGLKERVAGFGPKSIYIVAQDEDGIEHIRRHPWP